MPTNKKDFFKKMGASLKDKAESFVDTMDDKLETIGDNFEFGTFRSVSYNTYQAHMVV